MRLECVSTTGRVALWTGRALEWCVGRTAVGKSDCGRTTRLRSDSARITVGRVVRLRSVGQSDCRRVVRLRSFGRLYWGWMVGLRSDGQTAGVERSVISREAWMPRERVQRGSTGAAVSRWWARPVGLVAGADVSVRGPCWRDAAGSRQGRAAHLVQTLIIDRIVRHSVSHLSIIHRARNAPGQGWEPDRPPTGTWDPDTEQSCWADLGRFTFFWRCSDAVRALLEIHGFAECSRQLWWRAFEGLCDYWLALEMRAFPDMITSCLTERSNLFGVKYEVRCRNWVSNLILLSTVAIKLRFLSQDENCFKHYNPPKPVFWLNDFGLLSISHNHCSNTICSYCGLKCCSSACYHLTPHSVACVWGRSVWLPTTCRFPFLLVRTKEHALTFSGAHL